MGRGRILQQQVISCKSPDRRVRRPRRTAFQRISPDYSPWHTLSLMYSVAVKFALRFTNGAPSRRTLRDSVSLYLSVSIFAGMYRIGKLLSTASYPLTNPNLTAILLKLIHKCSEKEEYFSFARLERVRSVQAPRRGRRRSLWSRTAEFVKLFRLAHVTGQRVRVKNANSGGTTEHTSSCCRDEYALFCLHRSIPHLYRKSN